MWRGCDAVYLLTCWPEPELEPARAQQGAGLCPVRHTHESCYADGGHVCVGGMRAAGMSG